MPGFVEGIYIAPAAGEPMERLEEVAAIEGCGLAGDRYCSGTGHWSRFGRVACEVTLIAAEDLDAIEKETAIGVRDGEHRRNVVVRGVDLGGLRRRRFWIGGVVLLEYVGVRSVCRHVERVSERGMTQALKGRGGICARVVEGGSIRVHDEVEVLP